MSVGNGQGVAARKVLIHLGTGPFKTTSFKKLPHNSHKSLVVSLVTANLETFVVTNVVTQRVRFTKFSQDKSVLHVVVGLIAMLYTGQH